jgi:hypothetical protein
MKLIPFTDFPRWERDALHAALARLRMPLQHVCVSRLQPVPGAHDAALPPVVLVSAPGWSRTYEGSDWLGALERDLAALAPAARASGLLHPDASPSGPAPLGLE